MGFVWRILERSSKRLDGIGFCKPVITFDNDKSIHGSHNDKSDSRGTVI